ncbi:phospholipase C accessory protein PlcR [Paraburkholderia megapolitana]|uniref:Phospholipase C accessory protein PlcR n=1 Tax=Paraburkholderia megapolitana TaxID=420953 RepID=A0A1I3GVS0_9BURK|nr:phospholipase C accessory protein PlcR [Paraburkholderia megapolitana]QDQ83075.1 phospholipase C accessory protein PlcR [Paraburkholderia megapolitana]SFI27461.1 phospholipase C accessory protein PlcR [Paraburkholderia megapolitana]
MNRQNLLWAAAAIVVAGAAVSGVLLSSGPGSGHNSSAQQPASSLAGDASSVQNSKVNTMSSSTPADFQAQLEAYGLKRGQLSADARRTEAQRLIDELKQGAQAGTIDPRHASDLADMLWPDAEPDATKRVARSDALHQTLRDIAMPPVTPSPQREQQDQSYAVASRQVIADVTSSVSDRTEQRVQIDERLRDLRKRIYGDADAGRSR